MSTWSSEIDEAVPEAGMPDQSPAAGWVEVPSALVSPPAVSSLIEVKVTGEAAVPLAIREPSALREAYQGLANLSRLPAGMVRVVPVGMSVLLVSTTGSAPVPKPQVSSWRS